MIHHQGWSGHSPNHNRYVLSSRPPLGKLLEKVRSFSCLGEASSGVDFVRRPSSGRFLLSGIIFGHVVAVEDHQVIRHLLPQHWHH